MSNNEIKEIIKTVLFSMEIYKKNYKKLINPIKNGNKFAIYLYIDRYKYFLGKKLI